MAIRAKRDGDKCKKHPLFRGVVEPRPGNLYPKGCPTCWEIYEEKQAALTPVVVEPEKKKPSPEFLEASKKTQFKKGHDNPGIPQGTIKDYIQKRTKRGKSIVDAMMEIAGVAPKKRGAKPKDIVRFQTKDKITALKWLHAAGFDFDDGGDKDRPIQIVNYGEIYVGPRPPT